MSRTLYPTHTCFDDALEFIDYGICQNPKNAQGFTVVHAICVAPNGEEYSHAWVESDIGLQYVVFAGIMNDVKEYFVCEKSEYYRVYKIKDSTRYTAEEAVKQNLKHGNYGPWEPKYAALCNVTETATLLKGTADLRAVPIGPLPKKEGKKNEPSPWFRSVA